MYSRPATAHGYKTVRMRVMSRLDIHGYWRQQRIENYARCEGCGGTGIDKDKLSETFLDLRYYHCRACQGTGEKANFRG